MARPTPNPKEAPPPGKAAADDGSIPLNVQIARAIGDSLPGALADILGQVTAAQPPAKERLTVNGGPPPQSPSLSVEIHELHSALDALYGSVFELRDTLTSGGLLLPLPEENGADVARPCLPQALEMVRAARERVQTIRAIVDAMRFTVAV